jgi:aminocarboxymuconate-semialdehyde decarboxylase
MPVIDMHTHALSKRVEPLVATVGVDRVMMGSDTPFDMGDPDPVGLVNGTKLSEIDRQKIFFSSASGLFKIAN